MEQQEQVNNKPRNPIKTTAIIVLIILAAGLILINRWKDKEDGLNWNYCVEYDNVDTSQWYAWCYMTLAECKFYTGIDDNEGSAYMTYTVNNESGMKNCTRIVPSKFIPNTIQGATPSNFEDIREAIDNVTKV